MELKLFLRAATTINMPLEKGAQLTRLEHVGFTFESAQE